MVWGDNNFGQLAKDLSIESINEPSLVENITDVKQVAAGIEHSLVLLNDGTVKAWGCGIYGQCGNAYEILKITEPTTVKGLK